MFTVWLIVGAVLMYVTTGLFFTNCWKNETLSPKHVTHKGVYGIFVTSASLLAIWWTFGFGRLFGPARARMDGSSSSLGIYDDPFMQDPSCKLFLFTLPF